MKTVVVKARNLKEGDVLIKGKKNQRVKWVHRFNSRKGKSVLVVAPNPNGYMLDTITFLGENPVKVKRPTYNMKYRRKK